MNNTRKLGKLRHIILSASLAGATIVCRDEVHRKRVVALAEDMNVIIPNPMVCNKETHKSLLGRARKWLEGLE